MFTCPVCLFDALREPPSDWEICVCCGTQFEYDDCGKTHEELRAEWVAGGCKWFSQATRPPDNWDVQKQLRGEGSCT